MNTSLKAIFGLDSSNFRGELKRIDRGLDSMATKFSKIGLSAFGFQAVAEIFRSVVDHARNLEGELSANAAAAQRFARGMDEAKGSVLDVGVEALGVVNRFGEWIGRQVAIVKYGREQVELTERINTETEQNLQTIEEIRKAHEDIARAKAAIAALDKQAADVLLGSLPITDQKQALEQQYLDLVREAINLGPTSLAGMQKMIEAKQVFLKYQRADIQNDRDSAQNRAEIARLLLRGVENLTSAERLRLELLTGTTTARKVESEILTLMAKGVDKLTDVERSRLSYLVGMEDIAKTTTAEYSKQTLEVLAQTAELKAQMKLRQHDYIGATLDEIRAGGRGTPSQRAALSRIDADRVQAQRLLDSGNSVTLFDEKTQKNIEAGADFFANRAIAATNLLTNIKSSERALSPNAEANIKTAADKLTAIAKALEPTKIN